MSAILVTGGAGYIGSHTVLAFRAKGYEVVVVDNLTTGHRAAVPDAVPLYDVDIADEARMADIIRRHGIGAVVHFAAKSLVGESVAQPDRYFRENTAKTNQLLQTMLGCGVKTFIFSSTAAVYGIPRDIPIPETAAKEPINPYGASKWMIEQSLPWLEQAYGLRWIALRYFNAAGAALDGSIGEDHDPETHLIPLVLQTALGRREAIHLFGSDYDTPDGTCIRDYIHVLDLAEAHVLALEALARGAASRACNVGTGEGYSVRQVIETARKVTERNIMIVESPRRAGDPAVLVADAEAIRRDLGFSPKYSDLTTILRTAWAWHRTHPHGYRS